MKKLSIGQTFLHENSVLIMEGAKTKKIPGKNLPNGLKEKVLEMIMSTRAGVAFKVTEQTPLPRLRGP